jgi:arylsulfatase A-like enzyme
MPNLCAYAGENILFSRFYTQSSITLDSHMSLFTGLYPSTHQVINGFTDSLSTDIPQLAETLAARGYRTIWGGVTDDILLPLDKGLGRGFSEIYDMHQGSDPAEYKKLFPKLLDGTPTFIFLHSYAPHTPYLPGEGERLYEEAPEYTDIPVSVEQYKAHTRSFYEFVIADYVRRLQSATTAQSRMKNQQIVGDLRAALAINNLEKAREIVDSLPQFEQYDLRMTWYWGKINNQDKRMVSYLKGLYDEKLFHTDGDIFELLAFLRKPEVKRKTIVIFFSDNGEAFMEHGYFDHGWNIYNEETHTPLIVSVPKAMRGVYHELVQMVDIYPTLLSLVGIAQKQPVDGRSFLPIIMGKGEQHVGDTYLVGQHRKDAITSIRNNRWKLYKNNMPDKKYTELFDLLTDPHEQRNILGEHPSVALHLDSALEHILNKSPRYASESGEFPAWIDDEKRKELINEGYF